ncbi:MAG TPA: FliM/FliN family flagellar motor switch protein, partial [Planctomycetaceae bacterium]|nr:FliM/FliN family flagellar motor switch protein [Planctomycetaceae bacterium]
NNRLQTFAQELSLHLLPADLLAERYVALPTENLIEIAQSAQASPSAKMMELSVFHPDGTHEAAFAKILVIVPVSAPPLPAAVQAASDDASQIQASTEADFDDSFADEMGDEIEGTFAGDSDEYEQIQSNSAAASADSALRALRILRVPVTVSVRLAERKMSLGAVVALVPGSLVTFSKSCEDLLDLYVNNHRFCQGEAIKIGESFGLKVSKVGVIEGRRERIV